MESKRLLCTIEKWYPKDVIDGYVIEGSSFDHPKFGWCDWFHTSLVLTPAEELKEGAVIETLNSRYTLGKPLRG